MYTYVAWGGVGLRWGGVGGVYGGWGEGLQRDFGGLCTYVHYGGREGWINIYIHTYIMHAYIICI